jgi:hypothetical protein
VSTPSLFDQATAALKAGDTVSARNLLTQALKIDPQDARLWVTLSTCWSEPEKKRFCLEKALAIQPDDPQIRQLLSELPASSGGAAPLDPAAHLESIGEPPAAPEPAAQAAALLAPPEAPPTEPPASETAPAGTPPQEQPPAQPAPAATKQKSTRRSAARKPKRKNCLAQAGMLSLLAILALVAVGLLVIVLQQTGIDLLSYIQPSAPVVAPPAELPTFAMPPTWTPTVGPPPTEAPVGLAPTLLRPSATPLLTATPVPSITPAFALWRILIGQSVENRPIVIYRFGNGDHGRMIVAGIHGGSEANTIALANKLTQYLQLNPDRVPADISLYILPSLNPDGEALGDTPHGRFNANGVDLNRNFEKNWKSDWKGSQCVSSDPRTAGKAPNSEPEIVALMKFMLQHKVEVLVDYHSAGLGILPAGQPADPGSVKLAEAIAAVTPYDYPPVKTDCEYTGTLVDWAVSQGTLAAVDLELNSPDDPEYEANLKVLDLLLTWQP